MTLGGLRVGVDGLRVVFGLGLLGFCVLVEA